MYFRLPLRLAFTIYWEKCKFEIQSRSNDFLGAQAAFFLWTAHPKSSNTDTSSMAGLHGSISVELLSSKVGVVGTGDSKSWYCCSYGSGPDRWELSRGCQTHRHSEEQIQATSKWRPRRGDLVRNPSNLEEGLEERNPGGPLATSQRFHPFRS